MNVRRFLTISAVIMLLVFFMLLGVIHRASACSSMPLDWHLTGTDNERIYNVGACGQSHAGWIIDIPSGMRFSCEYDVQLSNWFEFVVGHIDYEYDFTPANPLCSVEHRSIGFSGVSYLKDNQCTGQCHASDVQGVLNNLGSAPTEFLWNSKCYPKGSQGNFVVLRNLGNDHYSGVIGKVASFRTDPDPAACTPNTSGCDPDTQNGYTRVQNCASASCASSCVCTLTSSSECESVKEYPGYGCYLGNLEENEDLRYIPYLEKDCGDNFRRDGVSYYKAHAGCRAEKLINGIWVNGSDVAHCSYGNLSVDLWHFYPDESGINAWTDDYYGDIAGAASMYIPELRYSCVFPWCEAWDYQNLLLYPHGRIDNELFLWTYEQADCITDWNYYDQGDNYRYWTDCGGVNSQGGGTGRKLSGWSKKRQRLGGVGLVQKHP